ncbi:MAG: CrcB family protein [Halodesulfurarchaeum sp.]|nr:CrcB family protein [Halodesulfurarchaeum sp.]
MIPIEPAHIVGTGGAIGAILRQLASSRIDGTVYPYGTITVNVAGTFLLGSVTFLGMGNELVLFLGTGVAGSFTTFSSFSVETVRLWETGDRYRAVGNAAGTFLGALLALGAAWILTRALAQAL